MRRLWSARRMVVPRYHLLLQGTFVLDPHPTLMSRDVVLSDGSGVETTPEYTDSGADRERRVLVEGNVAPS